MTEGSSLLNTKMWGCQAFEPQPVLETIWPILSKLNPKPMTTYQGADLTDLQEIRKPIMEGCMLFFSTDKIEKLIIGLLVVMKRGAVAMLGICPSDDYDFPVFELDLTEGPKDGRLLLDMHPLRDLVLDEWYREKYLDPVEPIWKEYLDLNKGTPYDWYRSFLSPYSITGRHETADDKRSNMPRLLECLAKYLEYYVDNVVAKAEPVKDPEGKAFAIKKKRAMIELYRANDPSLEATSNRLGFDLFRKALYHSVF